MKRAFSLSFLGAMMVATAVLSAQERRFDLDPAHTKVEFTLGSTLHTVHGTFHFMRGTIRMDSSTGKVSGELVVDAASGDSGSAARDRRMNGSILESDTYREIFFRPDRVEGNLAVYGKSQVQLHGLLTLHGTEHELIVPVDVDAEDGQYTASAHFSIPYVKWGMKNPSTLFLRVNDKVELTIESVIHVPQTNSASR